MLNASQTTPLHTGSRHVRQRPSTQPHCPRRAEIPSRHERRSKRLRRFTRAWPLCVTVVMSFALLAQAGAAVAATNSDQPVFSPAWTAGTAISTTAFPRQSFVGDHVSIVADPNGSGTAVAAMSVANSDQPYPGAHPRADLLTQPWYTQGSTLFTSIPVKIPTGLPPFYNSSTSFFQWAEAKDTAASFPSWGLGLFSPPGATENHYDFGTTSNVGYPWIGPAVDGQWHTAVVEAYYTAAPGQGWLQLWWDGQPVTFNSGPFAGQTRITGITTITDGAPAWPLDIDSYRSSDTDPGTVTIYHAAPEIGPTLASVEPVQSTSPVTLPIPAATAPAPTPPLGATAPAPPPPPAVHTPPRKTVVPSAVSRARHRARARRMRVRLASVVRATWHEIAIVTRTRIETAHKQRRMHSRSDMRPARGGRRHQRHRHRQNRRRR